MVSTCPPTSKSSSPFSNPLVTVPKAPMTIGIIITFMFHRFFNSLARSRYLSFFSHSFSFILWSAGTLLLLLLLLLLIIYLFIYLSFCCFLLQLARVVNLRQQIEARIRNNDPKKTHSEIRTPLSYAWLNVTAAQIVRATKTIVFQEHKSNFKIHSLPFFFISLGTIFIHYRFTLSEFFTPTLAGGISQESKWQQLSSDVQDSSQYSSWSMV